MVTLNGSNTTDNDDPVENKINLSESRFTSVSSLRSKNQGHQSSTEAWRINHPFTSENFIAPNDAYKLLQTIQHTKHPLANQSHSFPRYTIHHFSNILGSSIKLFYHLLLHLTKIQLLNIKIEILFEKLYINGSLKRHDG